MEKSINLKAFETKEKLAKVISESELPLILLDYIIRDLSAFLTNQLNEDVNKEISNSQFLKNQGSEINNGN